MTAARRRISERVSAITESATLAVDAKAKALRAAGRPVIGFGAGEPDFPTPDYIVAAAQRASAEPRFHKYSPTAGLPERRQAGRVPDVRDPARPGRRGAAADPVLDHLPRVHRAGRGGRGARADQRAVRVPRERRGPGGGL